MSPKNTQNSEESKVHNLTEMLDRMCDSKTEADQVSLDGLLDAVGRRSFGPILLLSIFGLALISHDGWLTIAGAVFWVLSVILQIVGFL